MATKTAIRKASVETSVQGINRAQVDAAETSGDLFVRPRVDVTRTVQSRPYRPETDGLDFQASQKSITDKFGYPF